MSLASQLQANAPAIVAILRGITPAEAAPVARALVDAGIRILEVPLNSPDAVTSIERLREACGNDALAGAGTVLTPAAVDEVAAAGARFVVAPNTNAAVIGRALERGLDPMPGIMTPTEMFAAIDAGATDLKVFPGATVGPGHIRALDDVRPDACRLWAVGGVSAANLADWLAAGAAGVGIGGALYRPGTDAGAVRERARELVTAWRRAA